MGKETDWQGSGKEVRGHCRKYISRYIVSWVINMSEMRETAKASAAQRAAASSERENKKDLCCLWTKTSSIPCACNNSLKCDVRKFRLDLMRQLSPAF
jgi:hypothetical protein